MGAVTLMSIWELFYGSPHTARRGIARLQKLGLVRSFPRAAVSFPSWYALTRAGHEWLADETKCEPGELRVVSSINRMNLVALQERNRFWASLMLAVRKHPGVRLGLFRTEAELRRLWAPGMPVVPDSQIVLEDVRRATAVTYFLEFDGGTERLSTIWKAKAESYRSLREAGPVYGASNWLVLGIAPSVRRAHNIARTVSDAGAGTFLFVAAAETLTDGQAFEPRLWLSADIAKAGTGAPQQGLLDLLDKSGSDPDLQS
jgi:hypothetical protein